VKEMNNYEIINQDCITWMHSAAKQKKQFDLSVFSPPFSSLYTYSNMAADMGNSRESDDEFIMHMRFFTDALFPIIKEGRNVCVHVQNPARSIWIVCPVPDIVDGYTRDKHPELSHGKTRRR
jgi:DNA modification methylase